MVFTVYTITFSFADHYDTHIHEKFLHLAVVKESNYLLKSTIEAWLRRAWKCSFHLLKWHTFTDLERNWLSVHPCSQKIVSGSSFLSSGHPFAMTLVSSVMVVCYLPVTLHPVVLYQLQCEFVGCQKLLFWFACENSWEGIFYGNLPSCFVLYGDILYLSRLHFSKIIKLSMLNNK